MEDKIIIDGKEIKLSKETVAEMKKVLGVKNEVVEYLSTLGWREENDDEFTTKEALLKEKFVKISISTLSDLNDELIELGYDYYVPTDKWTIIRRIKK